MELFRKLQKPYLTQTLLTGVVFVGMVCIAIFLSRNEAVVDLVERFGYWGMFGASILSGFNVVVPIPIIAFIPVFLEAGLALWAVVLTITLGMTLGDSVGYLLGSTGRKLVHPLRARSRILELLDQFRNRHPLFPYLILLGYVAFAPAPNEVIVIPLSFMGYKLRYIFPIVLVGNLIFNTLVALGVSWVI
jgi:membrane protein YqaA with SNARE-associated domain